MAQFTAYSPPPPTLYPVIGPRYCADYPVDPVIMRKVMNITDGNFDVKDSNGYIHFYLKGFLMTLHNRRVLSDAAGTPLVTLRQKFRSLHGRWQVFRGESTDLRDLIFTAKKPEVVQFNSDLDVFLANNTEEDVCDYKVKGEWFKKSCVVYAGESGTIVAEMRKKCTIQSFVFGKDKFQVRVYPGIDHAFIIALIMILDAVDPLPPGVSASMKLVTKSVIGIGPSILGS